LVRKDTSIVRGQEQDRVDRLLNSYD